MLGDASVHSIENPFNQRDEALASSLRKTTNPTLASIAPNPFANIRVLRVGVTQTSSLTLFPYGGPSCNSKTTMNTLPFETMSKRRKGYPSETHVQRGVRIVHGDKWLEEKLGREDPCPCGSGKRFKRCCMTAGCF
jgi:hypothetical protein